MSSLVVNQQRSPWETRRARCDRNTPPYICYCCADTTTGFRFRIGRRKELYSIQRIRIHFPHNNVEFDFALARICAPEVAG